MHKPRLKVPSDSISNVFDSLVTHWTHRHSIAVVVFDSNDLNWLSLEVPLWFIGRVIYYYFFFWRKLFYSKAEFPPTRQNWSFCSHFCMYFSHFRTSESIDVQSSAMQTHLHSKLLVIWIYLEGYLIIIIIITCAYYCYYLRKRIEGTTDYKKRLIRVYSSQIHSFHGAYRRQAHFSWDFMNSVARAHRGRRLENFIFSNQNCLRQKALR